MPILLEILRPIYLFPNLRRAPPTHGGTWTDVRYACPPRAPFSAPRCPSHVDAGEIRKCPTHVEISRSPGMSTSGETAMAMDLRSKGSLKADINVTPLVDVMLVLLIIMMLIAPMLRQNVL